MTIGPAPMIMIELMSTRLGIRRELHSGYDGAAEGRARLVLPRAPRCNGRGCAQPLGVKSGTAWPSSAGLKVTLTAWSMCTESGSQSTMLVIIVTPSSRVT